MNNRHGAAVENIVLNVYAKIDDDRLWNEKALVHRQSDNNKNPINNKNNDIRGPVTRFRVQQICI